MGISRVLYEFSKFQALVTQGTLPCERVPLIFREPGVLTGYRPVGRPWSYYLLSVFKLHNETINIWTHVVASFILIYRMLVFAQMFNSTGNDVFWIACFFSLCCLINTALSAFAHTFHSKSLVLHYLCYQGDYVGIGVAGLGQSIVFLHMSSSDWLYESLQWFALPLYVILAIVFVSGTITAKLRYKRPYPIQRKIIQLGSGAAQTLTGLVPIGCKYIACFRDPECPMTSLNHHTVWLITLTASVIFFSSHMPEKKYPGYFDCIGQGHQIFHVLVSLSLILGLDAVIHDVEYGTFRPLDHNSIIIAFVTTVLSCCLFIIFALRFTKRRAKADKKIK